VIKDSNNSRDSSCNFPTASAEKRGRITRKRKNLVGIKRTKKEKEEGKMRYYEFIPDFLGRYKSLFGFEYSILNYPSWASITVLRYPYLSMVGTHENILHFPSRFTRCILWQLNWKSIPRDCVIGADSRASRRETGWYFLSSACPSSYPLLDTWISRHRSNNLNP